MTAGGLAIWLPSAATRLGRRSLTLRLGVTSVHGFDSSLCGTRFRTDAKKAISISRTYVTPSGSEAADIASQTYHQTAPGLHLAGRG